MKLISQEVSMKKLKIKKKYIFLALISLFIGYIGLRYYIKPEWFDSEHIYHRVYNLKVSHKKGQKKIIQDINIEFVHFNEERPVDGQWSESIRTDLKSDLNYTIIHLSFTDNTKIDILFDRYNRGSLFKSDGFNYKQFNKLSLRFPGIDHGDGSEFRNYLMIYQGDTISQNYGNQYEVTSFQLKNPQTHKLQTYYEYDVTPESNIFPPVYFLQDTSHSAEERQKFFDDYQPNDSRNYWIRSSMRFFSGTDSLWNNRLNIELESYPYQLFYSERFENLPIHLDMTGDNFKMVVTETYVMDHKDNSNGIRVQSRSKTYTNENKDQYVTEILNNKEKTNVR